MTVNRNPFERFLSDLIFLIYILRSVRIFAVSLKRDFKVCKINTSENVKMEDVKG